MNLELAVDEYPYFKVESVAQNTLDVYSRTCLTY